MTVLFQCLSHETAQMLSPGASFKYCIDDDDHDDDTGFLREMERRPLVLSVLQLMGLKALFLSFSSSRRTSCDVVYDHNWDVCCNPSF